VSFWRLQWLLFVDWQQKLLWRTVKMYGWEKCMETLLQKLINECRPYTNEGKLASYIPELEHWDQNLLGVHVISCTGEEYGAGERDTWFTIQSVSKIMIFACCLMDSTTGEMEKKVSVEPTAEGFNSIVNLETKNANKPLNPFINSGAIACITLLKGESYEDKYIRVLDFIRKICGNDQISPNREVYLSEQATGSRNRALAYYMKSTGVIDGDVEEILDVYFKICSIQVTCQDLARIAVVFANHGKGLTGEEFFSCRIAKTVTATMTVCGMYDESGSFAIKVGLPSKSGVGGGIVSVVPGKMGIGVFGPALNAHGTSLAGMKLLERMSEELELSIF